MEGLLAEHERLVKSGTFTKSIDEIQKTIDLLVKARETIVASKVSYHLMSPTTLPSIPLLTVLQIQKLLLSTLRSSRTLSRAASKIFTKTSKKSASIRRSMQSSWIRYSYICRQSLMIWLILEQKFRDKSLPQMDYNALSSQPALINRAIAMHLLREGQFSVASTFLNEATKNQSPDDMTDDLTMSGTEQDLGLDSLKSESLRKQFANMYHILHELKNARNLRPAIEWAREKSDELEKRGSNLEFELGKLQFVWLFVGKQLLSGEPNMLEGRQQALEYARQELSRFRPRYLKELQQLCGAIAFCPNLQQSPYRRIFLNNDAWDEVAGSFTKEFCALLGLSADSPLYIAATAGAIALPHFSKLQVIMKDKRTEWTTQHEIPVMHSVFYGYDTG